MPDFKEVSLTKEEVKVLFDYWFNEYENFLSWGDTEDLSDKEYDEKLEKLESNAMSYEILLNEWD